MGSRTRTHSRNLVLTVAVDPTSRLVQGSLRVCLPMAMQRRAQRAARAHTGNRGSRCHPVPHTRNRSLLLTGLEKLDRRSERPRPQLLLRAMPQMRVRGGAPRAARGAMLSVASC